MSNDVAVKISGGGVIGLLAIILITLKLTGYITWAWVWVLSPIWISVSIGFILLVIIFLIAVVIAAQQQQ